MLRDWSIMFPLLLLAGCSAWNAERLEQATVTAIDDQLSLEMPLDEFRRSFPDAIQIDVSGLSSSWLVYTQKACFMCTTGDGFRRSQETYARVVHFERDRLKSVNPVSRWAEN